MDEIQNISVAEACRILGLKDETATISVPVAGRILGLSRDPSYAAVQAGELPCINLGRLKRVPVIRLAMMLLDETPASDPNLGSSLRMVK